MFGKNQLSPVIRNLTDTDSRYWVQEVFPTIQGEGPLAGVPAIFVRMAGCNLRCYFCDTDFESSTWHPTIDELFAAVIKAHDVSAPGARTVVITGGEPLRQPLGPIIERFLETGYRVQIETAGTIWDSSIANPEAILWVCSPKTGKVHKEIERYCLDYKYIVRVGDSDPEDGLPIMSTQQRGLDQKLYRPTRSEAEIWVQPCEVYRIQVLARTPTALHSLVDERATRLNVEHAVELCMRYSYRLSYQIHKVIGLP